MTYQASAHKLLFLDPREVLGHARKCFAHTFSENEFSDVSEFILVTKTAAIIIALIPDIFLTDPRSYACAIQI